MQRFQQSTVGSHIRACLKTAHWPPSFPHKCSILYLCHLTHAGALQNIKDLSNNFKWNWMTRHGEALLCLIQSVYEPNPTSNTGNHTIEASLDTSIVSFPAEPSISSVASSSSKRTVKLNVKMGPGSQCCSACHTLGHNSKLYLYLSHICS